MDRESLDDLNREQLQQLAWLEFKIPKQKSKFLETEVLRSDLFELFLAREADEEVDEKNRLKGLDKMDEVEALMSELGKEWNRYINAANVRRDSIARDIAREKQSPKMYADLRRTTERLIEVVQQNDELRFLIIAADELMGGVRLCPLPNGQVRLSLFPLALDLQEASVLLDTLMENFAGVFPPPGNSSRMSWRQLMLMRYLLDHSPATLQQIEDALRTSADIDGTWKRIAGALELHKKGRGAGTIYSLYPFDEVGDEPSK